MTEMVVVEKKQNKRTSFPPKVGSAKKAREVYSTADKLKAVRSRKY